jgi:hypothetical protein
MEKTRAAERAEKRRYWKDQLEKWKGGGLTQAQYCRENNLSVHCFLYWRKRILPAKPPQVSLVELPIPRPVSGPLPPHGVAISLVVDGHYRIEIDKGFDPATLDQVIRILSRL